LAKSKQHKKEEGKSTTRPQNVCFAAIYNTNGSKVKSAFKARITTFDPLKHFSENQKVHLKTRIDVSPF